MQKKGGLKFYARTNYLTLAVRWGDSTDSLDMIAAIEDSSYYLAHKVTILLCSGVSILLILSYFWTQLK